MEFSRAISDSGGGRRRCRLVSGVSPQIELTTSDLYSETFFDWQQEGARRAASIVLPIVQRLLSPTTVIDIGCGRGAWLRAFQELGVSKIRGIDGEYVDRSKLLIP